jgi:aminoglycoside phosphotransferase (APT) family kinase protein
MVQLIDDPYFPHIDKALDEGFMKMALQAFLQIVYDKNHHAVEITACTIKNKRHKPGKNFVCCYALELYDLNSQTTWRQTISARLCKSGNSQQELNEEHQKQQAQFGLSSPVLFLPELEMMLWLFPHDRKLIHLAKVLESEYLHSYLKGFLAELGCDDDSLVEAVSTEVLHYLPERSCMIRYRLTVIEPTKPEKKNRIVYGKNYRDNRGGEIFSVMCQLHEQLPKCAIPLAYDEETRTLWQSHITGEPLTWENLQGHDAPALLSDMAKCLVSFQQCQITTAESYGFSAIEEQLRDTVKAATPQDKDFADQINAWVEHLIRLRHDLFKGGEELTPLHQDLHLGNFMIERSGTCLIDLDSVCIGNPLADIGSLVTNFYRNGLQAGTGLDSINSLTATFLNLYAKQTPGRINYAHLHWFIAAAFIHEVIRRLYRQRHENGLKHVQVYFDLSRQYLSLIEQTQEYECEA